MVDPVLQRPMPSPASPSGSARGRWLHLALVTAIGVAVCAPSYLAKITEPDLGWHLALGRIILQSGIPRTNTLSWVAADHPSYPTSWAFEALAAATVDHLGLFGLQLLLAAGIAAVLFLLAWACLEAGGLAGVWVVPPIAVLLSGWLTYRPEMVSWVVFSGVLVAGLVGRRRGSRIRAGALALIAVGGNFHSGAVFGAVVLMAFCLEAYLASRQKRELLLAAAAGLALMANPGGAFNLWYLLVHLFQALPVRIDEFRPASLEKDWPMLLVWGLALVLGIGQRKSGWALLLATLGFGIQSIRTVRTTPELYLAAAPLLAAGLAGLYVRAGVRRVAGVVTAASLAACLPYDWLGRATQVRLGATFDEAVLPVRAARYLAENRLLTGGFTSFEEGGYLEFAVPGLRGFIDGRALAAPDSVFEAEDQAFRNPERFPSFLEHYGATHAVIPRVEFAPVAAVLLRATDWALVHWDGTDLVFVRRGAPEPLPSLIARDEYRLFRPDASATGLLKLPSEQLELLHSELRRFERFSPDDVYAKAIQCGYALRRDAGEASQVCARAADLARSPEELALLEAARRSGR